jgi:putative nucleotidyltransferase with HDIG domain
MLGVNTVKNLVLSFAILEQLRTPNSFKALSAEKFWEHSLAVGVIAKCLAVAKGVSLSEQEEYFVGGLLHDLGKIPLNHQFPDEYYQALDSAKRCHWSLAHAESVVFGTDHGTIGGMIVQKWRLSPAFSEVLACHHRPSEATEENRLRVCIVALADLFSQLLNIGSYEEAPGSAAFAEYLLDQVDVDWPTLYDMREPVVDEINRARIFLEITA